jgi:type IV secretion system protein VirB10
MNKKRIGIALILAILTLIVVAEFGSHSGNSPVPQKSRPTETRPTEPGLVGNFERETNQEAQELARLKAQKDALAHTLAGLQTAPSPFPGSSSPYGDGTQPPAANTNPTDIEALQDQQQVAAAGYYPQPAQPQGASSSAEELAGERKKREYDSLFASNVALDLRGNAATDTVAKPDQNLGTAEPATAGPAWRNPQEQAAQTPATPAQTMGKRTANDFDSASGKLYRLFEGQLIETVLTNRLNGAFSGPVDCMVTTDVYSHDGQTLLIPEGSRVLGKVSAVQSGQQQRLYSSLSTESSCRTATRFRSTSSPG